MSLESLSPETKAHVEMLAKHTRSIREVGGDFARLFTAAASEQVRAKIDADLMSTSVFRVFRAMDFVRSAEAFDEWCDLAGVNCAGCTVCPAVHHQCSEVTV